MKNDRLILDDECVSQLQQVSTELAADSLEISNIRQRTAASSVFAEPDAFIDHLKKKLIAAPSQGSDEVCCTDIVHVGRLDESRAVQQDPGCMRRRLLALLLEPYRWLVVTAAVPSRLLLSSLTADFIRFPGSLSTAEARRRESGHFNH